MPNTFLGHELEEWLPQEPWQGPPLPEFLGIYWPWYKGAAAPPPPGVYTCPYCGATFATEAEMNYHIQTQHAAPPIYTCPYCGATFATEAERDAHVQTQHPAPPALANLYGVVTNTVTGAPVAGAEVRVLAGTVIKGATTQADGTYLISDLSPGATIWACLADGYNILTDQPITLVEGNNELNIALTPIGGPPQPPPPGLANFYGIVTNATTGAPVVGALVDLSGMPRYTNSAGGFLFQYLTPGQYALTVTKEGYLEFRINLMVVEGNNQYNVSLTSPILGAVTIDSFEIQCDFAGETVNTRITITNNTGQTLIDQTPTGPYGGLVTQMGADAYKAPATDYGYHMDDVFLPRPWDRYGIGNVPPGTHTFSSSEPLRRVGAGAGIPRFQAWGVTEGTRGYVWVWLRSGDERTATYPIVVNEYFEGVFSASWQTWAKTNWRPPPMPDIFIP